MMTLRKIPLYIWANCVFSLIIIILFLKLRSLIAAGESFSSIALYTFFIFIFIVTLVSPFVKRLVPKWFAKLINWIHAIVTEAFGLMTVIVTYPFKQSRYNPTIHDIVDEVPILLIHGYLHNSAAWFYFRYRLNEAGFNNVFTLDLGYPFDSIETYADKVKDKVNEIRAMTGKNEVKIIGHSMGGLVGAYYAVALAPDVGVNVTHLVTMGSPLEGTVMSVIGIGKCVKQMRVDCPFVQNVTQKLLASGINCFHQKTLTDLIVFTNHRGKSIYDVKYYDDLGHVIFLFSDRVIKNTIKFLLHNMLGQSNKAKTRIMVSK